MQKLIKIDENSGIPLIGSIAFGILDRGTSLIEVRPTTVCNLNCPFCSTDSGPNSKFHPVNYEVELNYLLKWIKEIVGFKGKDTEVHIDSVGEPLTYKKILELVREVSKFKNVSFISMQTNGTLLTPSLLKELGFAGLNRINLTINSLNPQLSKTLSGTLSYDLKKILKLVDLIKKSKIELLITPVWIKGVNDKDVEDLIGFAKNLGIRIGIQKYEIYKYGRKMRQANHVNWWKFYQQLKLWENNFNHPLKLTKKSLNIEKRERLPTAFDMNEKVSVIVRLPGWIKGQMIGVAKNSCVSINNYNAKINDRVNVRILENKNNIYIAE